MSLIKVAHTCCRDVDLLVLRSVAQLWAPHRRYTSDTLWRRWQAWQHGRRRCLPMMRTLITARGTDNNVQFLTSRVPPPLITRKPLHLAWCIPA